MNTCDKLRYTFAVIYLVSIAVTLGYILSLLIHTEKRVQRIESVIYSWEAEIACTESIQCLWN